MSRYPRISLCDIAVLWSFGTVMRSPWVLRPFAALLALALLPATVAVVYAIGGWRVVRDWWR